MKDTVARVDFFFVKLLIVCIPDKNCYIMFPALLQSLSMYNAITALL